MENKNTTEYLKATKDWIEFCNSNYTHPIKGTLNEFNDNLYSLFADTPDVAIELIENEELKGVLDFDTWDVLDDTYTYEEAYKFWEKHNNEFFIW